MHRPGFVWSLTLAACLVLSIAWASVASASYPGTADGLKRLMSDIYNAKRDGRDIGPLVRPLALPNHDAWFRRVFGDEVGARVAREYAGVQGRFVEELDRLFAMLVREGQSEIHVLRFDRPGDPKAVGFQNDALAGMKVVEPLFSVRFLRPGEPRGQHVYSFVHVDGGFRLVGRMRAVKERS